MWLLDSRVGIGRDRVRENMISRPRSSKPRSGIDYMIFAYDKKDSVTELHDEQ